ncbi:MAG: hypothetical protein KJ645_05765, partial [Planctomycetes bacterium]|nr:hypothetical protein [Planctomycetota bacterium]
VLPEIYPGIEFDEQGVCSVCRNHVLPKPKGEEALKRILEKKRGKSWDCVCALSGGRDSVYALYLAVRRFGLRTIAVSFDNDFRTDQALKNMVNACERLDVPLRSIKARNELTKRIVKDSLRFYIPKGPVMVAKHLCGACLIGAMSSVFGTAVREGVPFVFLGDSEGEALSPELAKLDVHGGHLQRLFSREGFIYLRYALNLMRLRFQLSPASMKFGIGPPGTNGKTYRVIKVYDYIEWDKDEIEDTIRNELAWSEPEGSASSWRIDCELGLVKHFCSMKKLGFTTMEDGLSNMIRNGKMTREEAMQTLSGAKWGQRTEVLDKVLTHLDVPTDLRETFYNYEEEFLKKDV